jgi:uncharacterized membrane protein YkvA (DUF1232 family)
MSKESLREKGVRIKSDIYALFLAYKESSVPWYAKALIVLIIGYFLSPIDLIPYFIPVLGQLDDLIIVPVGIALAIKMIPKVTLEECRRKAREEPVDSRTKWVVGAIIILVWVIVIYSIIKYIGPLF